MLTSQDMQQIINLIKTTASVVYKGSGSPTTTPLKVGDVYINEAAGDIWMSTMITDVIQWVEIL